MKSPVAVRRMLQFGLFLVLILPGLDEAQYFLTRKWFITDWNDYLAPIVSKTVGLDRDTTMLIVGVVQIGVALALLVRPRIGAFAACIGFCLIIANLLLHSAYDIVIRDFGLLMAALALGIAAKNDSVGAPVLPIQQRALRQNQPANARRLLSLRVARK